MLYAATKPKFLNLIIKQYAFANRSGVGWSRTFVPVNMSTEMDIF